MNDLPEEEEELNYNISDQDLSEDSLDIVSIIKERIKVFQNEETAIKIFLSRHFSDFRKSFFTNLNNNKRGIYEEIKQQIRNILNSFRIKLDDEKVEVSNELNELIILLSGYYKKVDFDKKFFVNYFTDIKEMNRNRKRFANNYPKNETETINDIERKYKIIKDLNHYLNTYISDRIQINFDTKFSYDKNPYSELKFNYLVIDEEVFSKMNENEIEENLSNKPESNKLRRPLNTYISHNYLPILCKGSCLKEAEFCNNEFEKWIINHINDTGCEKCEQIKQNLDNIKSQIRSLYIKTCIFSHNINEVMLHPLNLFTMSSFEQFYKSQLIKKPNKNVRNLVREISVPTIFSKGRYEIQIIYNPAQEGMKAIYNKLTEYSKKDGIYLKCCNKAEFKTQRCPIKFNPNNYEFFTHMKKCPYYHSNLEKRRLLNIVDNEICENAIKAGQWIFNDQETIECNNGNFCNKFHTRNELFFDERNYRKLYPCTETYYCEKGELCPKKHAIDIKINEIFLPKNKKKDLQEILDDIKKKDEMLKNKLKKFNVIQCVSCMNLINGIQNNNMIAFNCRHKICTKCYNFFQSCPLCEKIYIQNEDENIVENNNIEILLNYEIPKKKKKKKSDEEKEESDGNSSMIKSKKYNKDDDSDDNDITFPKNGNYSSFNNYYSQNNEYNRYNISFNRAYNDNNYYKPKKYYGEYYRGRGRGFGRGPRSRKDYGNYNYRERNDNYYKNESYNYEENNDNNNYKLERKGKGHVRGSKRGIRENISIREEQKEYYVVKEDDENYSNILKFEGNEEKKEDKNEENEGEANNYEEECSMRKEIRKGKGKVRGGKKGKYNNREREVEKSLDEE